MDQVVGNVGSFERLVETGSTEHVAFDDLNSAQRRLLRVANQGLDRVVLFEQFWKQRATDGAGRSGEQD